MDQELEKWYETQFELFGTQGWKDLMEVAKASLEQQKTSINYDKDMKEFGINVGNQESLQWLLSWQETCERVYKELKDA